MKEYYGLLLGGLSEQITPPFSHSWGGDSGNEKTISELGQANKSDDAARSRIVSEKKVGTWKAIEGIEMRTQESRRRRWQQYSVPGGNNLHGKSVKSLWEKMASFNMFEFPVEEVRRRSLGFWKLWSDSAGES